METLRNILLILHIFNGSAIIALVAARLVRVMLARRRLSAGRRLPVALAITQLGSGLLLGWLAQTPLTALCWSGLALTATVVAFEAMYRVAATRRGI